MENLNNTQQKQTTKKKEQLVKTKAKNAERTNKTPQTNDKTIILNEQTKYNKKTSCRHA
jgi:hypothetical protein